MWPICLINIHKHAHSLAIEGHSSQDTLILPNCLCISRALTSLRLTKSKHSMSTSLPGTQSNYAWSHDRASLISTPISWHGNEFLKQRMLKLRLVGSAIPHTHSLFLCVFARMCVCVCVFEISLHSIIPWIICVSVCLPESQRHSDEYQYLMLPQTLQMHSLPYSTAPGQKH